MLEKLNYNYSICGTMDGSKYVPETIYFGSNKKNPLAIVDLKKKKLYLREAPSSRLQKLYDDLIKEYGSYKKCVL